MLKFWLAMATFPVAAILLIVAGMSCERLNADTDEAQAWAYFGYVGLPILASFAFPLVRLRLWPRSIAASKPGSAAATAAGLRVVADNIDKLSAAVTDKNATELLAAINTVTGVAS